MAATEATEVTEVTEVTVDMVDTDMDITTITMVINREWITLSYTYSIIIRLIIGYYGK